MRRTVKGLHLLVRIEHVGILFALLIISFGIRAQDNPLPNLHMAAVQGDVEVVQQHVEAGSDLDALDAYGSTALNVAITFGHTAVAQTLIKGGADLEIADAYGSGPLHLAALFGRAETATALIQAGANKYALTNNGATPFDVAAVPFDKDTALLQGLQAQLGQFGLHLDLEQIKLQRAVIADALRPAAKELEAIDIAPPGDTPWPINSNVGPGLKRAIAELIYDARHYSNIKSIIILKDGEVVTEKYFNGQEPDSLALVQSVTKSYFCHPGWNCN